MRKLVKDTFGVEFDALTYEIIERYFSGPREESVYLEFKRYSGDWNKDLPDIQKAMGALLNSEGGIIVWGSPKTGGKREEDITETKLKPITKEVDSRNINQKLCGQIDPYPSGVEAIVRSKGGNSIVIISVERTRSTPYMVRERGYYYRVGKDSKMAPHHYVEALMKQVSFPDIRCHISKHNTPQLTEEDHYNMTFKVDFFVFFTSYSRFENEHNFVFRYHIPVLHARAFNPTQEGVEVFAASDKISFQIGFYVTFKQNIYVETARKIPLIIRWQGLKSPARCSRYLIDLNSGEAVINNDFENKFFHELTSDEWVNIPDLIR